MKKLPIFGSGIRGKTPTLNSERRVNCYYEIIDDENRTKLTILGTPGTSLYSNVGSTPPRAGYVFNNLIFTVCGPSIYSLDLAGNKTLIGSLNTNNGFVTMSDNGTQLAIVDGKDGWIYTIPNGSFQQIPTTDGFPEGCTTIAFLDGRFLAEKPGTGQFFASDSYNGLSWDALNFATAESLPDNVIAVDTDHGSALLWGSLSIEYWQNTGTLGFPFAPLRAATQQWGLAAKWSRAKFNDTMVFLAQNLQGQCQVMMLQNFVPVRISTHNIESIINSFPIINDAIGMSYMVNGHSMYQITFPGLNRSFLYDGTSNLWSETKTGVGLTGRHIANQAFTYNSRNYVTDSTSGNILLLSDDIFTDNGQPIKREIWTRHIENDGNIGSVDEVELILQNGVGLANGQGRYPEIMMQKSIDGGNTFQMAERKVMFGASGQFRGPRAIFRRCGAGESMVLKFSMTDPVRFAIAYATGSVQSIGK